MRSNMGLPLSQLLFQTGDTIIAAELATMVDKQLALFEPGVKAVSVTPVATDVNGGVASIAVNYQPILAASQASSVANIVTIQVGGTVTEVTPNGTS